MTSEPYVNVLNVLRCEERRSHVIHAWRKTPGIRGKAIKASFSFFLVMSESAVTQYGEDSSSSRISLLYIYKLLQVRKLSWRLALILHLSIQAQQNAWVRAHFFLEITQFIMQQSYIQAMIWECFFIKF